MHRLIARLLLFMALAGNLLPLALAMSPPPSVCCLRKGVHHCQNSLGSESEQLAIRDASCCNHDCRRAVTTAQWAHPQPKLAAFFVPTITASLTGTEPNCTANGSAEFQSSRAPPRLLKLPSLTWFR
jgi:hypothetical protein